MDATSPGPHLLVEDLRVGFKTHEGYKSVLNLEELHIDHGEALGLVGESGSGKSVLALTILRLLRTPPAEIDAGRLWFEGRDLLSLSPRAVRSIRGREIAMIFQDPMSSLNPVFTVGSQLLHVISRIHGEKGRRARARAERFIRLVGLPDPETMLHKYPHQLSGGQRQRVIIALALCCDAKLIIADEPTRNLDVTVQAGVLKTIAALREELGVSLLFIANNLSLVSATCDRVGVLLDGRIVETGSVGEVIDDPRHPYTRMLLRAVSAGDESAYALSERVEAGEAACPYYGRCDERGSICEEASRPELTMVAGSHEVACFTSAVLGVKQ